MSLLFIQTNKTYFQLQVTKKSSRNSNPNQSPVPTANGQNDSGGDDSAKENKENGAASDELGKGAKRKGK